MKKLINFRLSPLLLLSVALGIFAFYKFLFANYWVLTVAVVLLAAGAVVLACLKSKWWKACLLALVFVAIGFGCCFGTYCVRKENTQLYEYCVVKGRVTDINRNGEASNTLYLENCQADGDRLPGKVRVFVFDGEQYKTGDIVSVYGALSKVYAFKETVDTFAVRNNVRYEMVASRAWEGVRGKLTFAETVRKYVFDTTSANMPLCGDIAYALLTGDRNALDPMVESAFINAGIIHLLVVSGLHIGFVVAVLHFVLKRLRVGLVAELATVLVFAVFYAYVCDFTPSVVRAIVMTVCVYFSRFLHGRYDLLTSLCWAALFILLVRPLYLFDIGFQLSVMSVFGIATVYLQIDRIFAKRKMPKFVRWLLSTLSMSLSCVVSTLFVTAIYFGKVPLLGILVNIVAIPLVFASFVVCLVGLLPWVFHYLLWIGDQLLSIVLQVAKFVESLNAVLVVSVAVVSVAISVLLLFVAGGYVNLNKRPKQIVYSVGSVLLALCILSAYIPQKCSNCVGVFLGRKDAMVVAMSQQGEAAVVGNFGDDYATKKAASYLKNKEATVTLYVTEMKSSSKENFQLILKDCTVSSVYVLDGSGNSQSENYLAEQGLSVVKAVPNRVLGQSVAVQPVYDGGLSGVVVKVGNICVATVLGGEVKTERFRQLRTDVNFYIIDCAFEAYAQNGLNTFSFYQQNLSGNFGANKYGNFTISEKGDKILLNFRRN